jgi:hypothetical protein
MVAERKAQNHKRKEQKSSLLLERTENVPHICDLLQLADPFPLFQFGKRL